MEYAARATASHRKKPVKNIRIELKNSEDKDGGVISGSSNATTNHFNYIVGESNLETKSFGPQPDQPVHSRSQSSPHLFGYKSAKQGKPAFLSESNIATNDGQSRNLKKIIRLISQSGGTSSREHPRNIPTLTPLKKWKIHLKTITFPRLYGI